MLNEIGRNISFTKSNLSSLERYAVNFLAAHCKYTSAVC